MYNNKIAEFNYKLLHCILNNNLAVSKRNKTVSPLCDVCLVDEYITHLLFECNIVKNIWQNIEKILCFRITWKHIVLGFYDENNSKTRKINNFISFVCYNIYKYKMKCRFEENHMSKENLILKTKA